MGADSLGVGTLTKPQFNLLAGDHDPIQIPVTTASDASAMVLGTVLGRVTATGKYKGYAAGNSDGTQVPRAILARDVDSPAGNTAVTAYVHGEFNANALTGLDAAATLKLQEFGIFIKEVK
ncbi:MAG: head decoration protein [Nitrospirae bacterium]|nr:head decoration protein [Nitrospirota bacterium]